MTQERRYRFIFWDCLIKSTNAALVPVHEVDFWDILKRGRQFFYWYQTKASTHCGALVWRRPSKTYWNKPKKFCKELFRPSRSALTSEFAGSIHIWVTPSRCSWSSPSIWCQSLWTGGRFSVMALRSVEVIRSPEVWCIERIIRLWGEASAYPESRQNALSEKGLKMWNWIWLQLPWNSALSLILMGLSTSQVDWSIVGHTMPGRICTVCLDFWKPVSP